MNKTLTNGLRLLSLIASSDRAFGVTELTHLINLPKSHVHRLLQSLLAAELLEKDKHSRYRISVGALRLGHELLRNIPIRRAALPEMMGLVREHSLNLTLAIPYGHQAISVAHVTHDGHIRGSMESLGSTLSAYASASGKLFLAYKTQAELSEILPLIDFRKIGPNTHTSATSLRKDLIQIRKRGYSINNRENGSHSISIAVPIRNQDDEVFAALGCSGQPSDLSDAGIVRKANLLLHSIQRIEDSIRKENPT